MGIPLGELGLKTSPYASSTQFSSDQIFYPAFLLISKYSKKAESS